MKLEKLTLEQMEFFLAGSQPIAFAVADTKDKRYKFVDGVLKRYAYRQLKRCQKGTVIQFLEKVSGYSRQQITRMVQRYIETGSVRRHQKTINGFNRIYLPEDVQLLVRLDQRHDTPNGLMVKKLCERAYHDFDEQAYVRLSKISVSHIYNLRKSAGYLKHRYHYEKTKSPKGVHIAGLLNTNDPCVYQHLFKAITHKKTANRPWREEPRCRKRRPKPFPLLQHARGLYKNAA